FDFRLKLSQRRVDHSGLARALACATATGHEHSRAGSNGEHSESPNHENAAYAAACRNANVPLETLFGMLLFVRRRVHVHRRPDQRRAGIPGQAHACRNQLSNWNGPRIAPSLVPPLLVATILTK